MEDNDNVFNQNHKMVIALCPDGRLRRPPGRDMDKAASFEGDTVVPLSAALLNGGSAASSGLPRGNVCM